MRRTFISGLSLACLSLLSSCSPRDFLTRRLAADLIAGSNDFKAPQKFWLRTGVISNQDYLTTEYLALQHRGWISASIAPCPPQAPSPCWDVMLTPSGVDTVRSLISAEDAEKPPFSVLVARRELLAVTGIAKQGHAADVEFTWRWFPLNELGAALYSSDLRYTSTAGFRYYDDGWRVVQGPAHSAQSIDEALKNAEPAQ